MEILFGKTEVIRNWCCWYYEEILENLSGIISVKLGKNYEEIVEKLWKNIGNRSHKLKKTYFDENLVKFSRQFFDELTKNYMETPNNLKRKLQKNFEEILEISRALLKIRPRMLQSLFRRREKMFFWWINTLSIKVRRYYRVRHKSRNPKFKPKQETEKLC